MMVKTGSEVCKVSAEACEVSVVMAAEERHKSPSKLGRAGEERQKVPLGVALGVCSIGSESLTLPVTLVKVPWKGAFSLAEAERAELELLGLHSWSLNAFRVFRQITPQSRRTLQLVLDSGRVPSPANRFSFAPSTQVFMENRNADTIQLDDRSSWIQLSFH